MIDVKHTTNDDGGLVFNPDGSPHYTVVSDGHVVMTGPATGVHTLQDGASYDVTSPFIEVASQEHALELAQKFDRPDTAAVPADETPKDGE